MIALGPNFGPPVAKRLEAADASSQSAIMDAALVSHETSRRDIDASPVRTSSSVLGSKAEEDGRDAAMAGGAGGDPPSADSAHRAAEPIPDDLERAQRQSR